MAALGKNDVLLGRAQGWAATSKQVESGDGEATIRSERWRVLEWLSECGADGASVRSGERGGAARVCCVGVVSCC